jgi:hypothetical protein
MQPDTGSDSALIVKDLKLASTENCGDAIRIYSFNLRKQEKQEAEIEHSEGDEKSLNLHSLFPLLLIPEFDLLTLKTHHGRDFFHVM